MKRLFQCVFVLTVAFAVVQSCTDFQEEEAPVSFSVDAKEVTFSSAPSTCLVKVSSGTKWEVNRMPEWINIQSIARTGFSPYEWTVCFSASENNEYNREGRIFIKAETKVAEVVVLQEGKKGRSEYIDLGLSVKWATCNLGASQPSDYGVYYAWGEVSRRELQFWPRNYTWFTLMYEEPGTPKKCYYEIRKYVLESDYNNGREPEGDDRLGYLLYIYPDSSYPPDNKQTLEPEDDAARSLLGDGWRIPTIEEWQELIDQCEWAQTTINGIEGYMFFSKVNGNSFFIPYSGWVSGSTVIDQGSYGDYWSSSRSVSRPFVAKSVSFGQSSGILSREAWHRYSGLSIRPVYTK